VSVMAETGMPLLVARSTWARTSGVEFWLLKTYTLIWWVLIWASHVALSAAVGSLPSLMASRNLLGVSRLRPRASAIGVNTLSDAPTATPLSLALMSAINEL